MVSAKVANIMLDIGIEVFILFSFLTVFFFAYGRKIEQSELNDNLKSLIASNTDNIMDQINYWDNELAPGTVDWKALNNVGKELVKTSTESEPSITNNNKKVFRNSVIGIIILFVILIVMSVILTVKHKHKINWKKLLLENLIVFILVGALEFFFFTTVATKYIPTSPEFVSNTILERMKYNVDKSI